jgi:hypothetical protein
MPGRNADSLLPIRLWRGSEGFSSVIIPVEPEGIRHRLVRSAANGQREVLILRDSLTFLSRKAILRFPVIPALASFPPNGIELIPTHNKWASMRTALRPMMD